MKRIWLPLARNGSILAMILGMLALLSGLCGWLVSITNADAYGPGWGALWLLVAAGLVVGGGLAYYHAEQSQKGVVSAPARLPGLAGLAIFWVVALAFSAITRPYGVSAILYPGVVVLAVGLPLLAALAWLLPRGDASAVQPTVRQFHLAATAGALAAPLLAGAALLLVLAGLAVCVDGFAYRLGPVVDFLSGEDREALWMLRTPTIVWLLAGVALPLPLLTTAAKTLVALPWMRRELPLPTLFWIGAAAGAGFALAEGVLILSLLPQGGASLGIWLALGTAIQPLGGGLAALGGEQLWGGRGPAAPERLSLAAFFFAAAAGLDAAWNSLSLALWAETSREFWRYFDLESLVIALVLFILGSGALWAGRYWALWLCAWPTVRPLELPGSPARRLALWSAACLLIVAPLWSAALLLGRMAP